MLTAVEVRSAQDYVPELVLPLFDIGPTDPLHIRGITGLEPVKAEVNSRGYGSLDGEYYTDSHVGKRNIVITLGFNPASGPDDVAAQRKRLYAYCMPKTFITLVFRNTHMPDVQIAGIVESNAPVLFAQDPEVQISVICVKPNFRGMQDIEVTGWAEADATETHIDYHGDVIAGIDFELHAPDEGYNGYVELYTKAGAALLYRKLQVTSTINEDKYIRITTHQGAKTADSMFEEDDTRERNLLGTIPDDSLWTYLSPGDNTFFVKIAALNGRPWKLTYTEQFGGI